MNELFFQKFYGKDKFKDFVLMYENHNDEPQNNKKNGKCFILNIFFFLCYLLQSYKHNSKLFITCTLIVSNQGYDFKAFTYFYYMLKNNGVGIKLGSSKHF